MGGRAPVRRLWQVSRVNVGMMIWGEVNVTNGTYSVSERIQPVCEPDEWSGWRGESRCGWREVLSSLKPVDW